MNNQPALVVDKAGLARKLAHRPKAFVLFELLQNAWDEYGVTRVTAGARFFAEPKRSVRVLQLLIHEFAHDAVHDHLSAEFHEECARLGANLAGLCLDEPEMFRD